MTDTIDPALTTIAGILLIAIPVVYIVWSLWLIAMGITLLLRIGQS